jgi:hypothetical protein
MFILLLIGTLVLAIIICAIVWRFFKGAVDQTVDAIVGPGVGGAWKRYIGFAIYVVGISGGVRLRELENFLTPSPDNPMVLDMNRWVLELYRTILGSLQSIAWMLLVFFAFALVAFVISRSRNSSKATAE